ncbi:hypothetical protein N3K66_000954 [Trichothecium roseum]|uniref:Uncharacterized protein n=1 Tax=Trichothecium roseum TaxID=47278 RepID=A0ACC0VF27_9HYPO|nr:hypothetical protein N3K66_000954 [Trichothecium roseum]
MASKTFTLNTGAKIPAVGLGTWQSAPGQVQTAVTHALKSGYRLVDCAYCYGNEDEVGAGLAAAFAEGAARREDVFVVSKVWATYNSRVEEGLDKSLKSLGLDYVDLYLVHWPALANPEGNHDKFPTKEDGTRDMITSWNHVDTWKQMEALVEKGKVKAIGVCNYSKKYLDELLPQAKITPAVNQIENHPWLPQQEVLDACAAAGVHVMAYSPLGSTGSPLAEVPVIVELAKKKGVTPAAILLSLHVAKGRTVLAKSVTPARITANLESVVDLGADDLAELDAYSRGVVDRKEWKRFVYPPFGVSFGFPDKP